MLHIRAAKTGESEILTDIAIKSEAHWGYDSDFMEKFKSKYKVAEEFISNNPTFVIQEDDNIIGFYGIIVGNKEISLEYFYIEPQSIGKGYGKVLWNHVVSNCKILGIREFILVTSPQAKEFYTKMGAVPSGETESLVNKGRKVPRLIYTIGK